MICPPRTIAFWMACSCLVACSKSEISDTEGRIFSFECGGAGCTLIPKDAQGNEATAESFVLHNQSRILTVCPGKNPDFACRALTCKSGGVCSQLGGSGFTCEKGLCQAPNREIAFPDRLALCLSGTGTWQRSVEQIERLTLARACKPPCTLPASCGGP